MFNDNKELFQEYMNVPFRDGKTEVREEVIFGDGDCGFHLFIDKEDKKYDTAMKVRDLVAEVLLGLAKKKKVPEDLYDEIYHALSYEHVKLPTLLQEEWNMLVAALSQAENEESEERRLALADYFPNETKLPWDAEQLISHYDDSLKNYQKANKLRALLDVKQEASKSKSEFCRRQDVYSAYVNSYKNNMSIWLGLKSAKYFAREQGFSFYLWRKDEQDGEIVWNLLDEDCYEAKDPIRTIYAVYQDGNHFNRVITKDPDPMVTIFLESGEKDPYVPQQERKGLEAPDMRPKERPTSQPEGPDSSTFEFQCSEAEFSEIIRKMKSGISSYSEVFDLFKKIKLSEPNYAPRVSSEILEGTKSNKDMETILWETLKLGEDKYVKFIKFLLNNLPHERNKMIKSLRADIIAQVGNILECYFNFLICATGNELFLLIGDYLKSHSFTSHYKFNLSLLTYVQEAAQVQIKSFQESLASVIHKYCVYTYWSTDPEPLIKGYNEKFKVFIEKNWPIDQKTFFYSDLALFDLSEENLAKVQNYCQSMIADCAVTLKAAYEMYQRLDKMHFNTIEDEKGELQRNRKARLTRQAEELWLNREKEIPKAMLHAWQSSWTNEWKEYCEKQKKESAPAKSKKDYMKEKFMTWSKTAQASLPPSLIEEKTGNTLAMVALKYGNKQVFQFVYKKCGLLPSRDFEQNNHRGLRLVHYLSLPNKDIREEIYEAEPHHDELVDLEKAVRKYLDNWEEEKQTREIIKESWYPHNIVVNFLIFSRAIFSRPFEERVEKCSRVLKAIEETRDSKEAGAFNQLLIKLDNIYRESKDGILSPIRNGKFRGILSAFNSKHGEGLSLTLFSGAWAPTISTGENERLKAECESLRREKESFARSAASSEEELTRLREENKELLKQLDQEKIKVERLYETEKNLLSELEQERREKEARLEDLVKENKALVQKVEVLSEEIETLTKTCGKISEKYNALLETYVKQEQSVRKDTSDQTPADTDASDHNPDSGYVRRF
jgi:hypothetical protein